MPRDDIDWALAELRATRRRNAQRLYRDYYDGRHRLLFATKKYRRVFNRVFKAEDTLRDLGFSDTICSTVVDAHVERPEEAELHVLKLSRSLGGDQRSFSAASDPSAMQTYRAKEER